MFKQLLKQNHFKFSQLMSKLMRQPGWRHRITNLNTDEEIVNALHEWYCQRVFHDINVKEIRSAAKVRELKLFIPVESRNARYLDYGSGDSYFSEQIGLAFGMATYATDREEWITPNARPDNIQFEYLRDGRIPFPNIQFDVVTTLMVLHHIVPEGRTAVYADIASRMSTGGVFIVREHSIRNGFETSLVHAEHMLLSCVVNDVQYRDFIDRYRAYYQSANHWIREITKTGLFKFEEQSRMRGATNYVYLKFVKL